MIDREFEVQEFHSFLQPQSPEWLLVFHGQNGIGKTTLLAHLMSSIEANSTVACLDFLKTSSVQWSCTSVLEELNQALKHSGLPKSKRTAYKRKQDELDKWNAVQKIQISQVMEAQEGARILDSRQEIKIDLNKSLLKFDQEANIKRALAWLELVAEIGNRLVIFIDHWDLLVFKEESLIRRWLLENLLLEASRRFPGFRVVVMSNYPFDEYGFDSGTLMIELKPLEKEFANLLLGQEGVDRNVVRDFLVEHLGGNPLLLRLAGALYRENPNIDLSGLMYSLDIQAVSKWLLERMSENFQDETSRKALSHGVILDYFNLEMLRSICEDEKMQDVWFDKFSKNPFVIKSAGKVGCQEFVRTVREIQISWLWTQERTEFERLHGIALDWYHQLG